MKLLLGKILWNAILLNRREQVTTYVCVQGNTDCLNVTVEMDKTPVYTNRVFTSNIDGLRKISEDLVKMRRASV